MAVLNPASVPLSLYIHMPWCVRKCPYCDFNSHAVPDGALSAELEQTYLKALVADFETQVEMAQGRSIHSVFIGGGTLHLFLLKVMHGYLNSLNRCLTLKMTVKLL
ncbi:coproporphyrinogen dehydrogenase domain protein [Acinetobacter baumannii 110912]|nr:coproporphyrinogen dehydrogenase domain protein [Acinetobacter baumannii 110912]